MIGVPHILDVELPVARQQLVIIAEEHDRFAHHAVDPRGDIRSKIGFERRRRRRERAEHDAGEALDPKRADIVMDGIEIGGHAALAGDAAAERDPGQAAFEVVSPVVIDAADFAPVPGAVEAEEGAAMGATILESAEAAIPVTGDDDRDIADEGRAVIARIGELDLEAEKIPRRAHEELLMNWFRAKGEISSGAFDKMSFDASSPGAS